jgi:hypothetical protein
MKHGLQKHHFFAAGGAKSCNLTRFFGKNRIGGNLPRQKLFLSDFAFGGF